MPTSRMSTGCPRGASATAWASSTSAWRDGVHPDAAWPELVRQVAAGRLQCGLDRSHQVVVRHHLVGAVVAHGEQGAAIAHERHRPAGQPQEGVAGDVHRLREAGGRAVQQATLQIGLRGEGNGMEQQVKLAPSLSDRVEDGIELRLVRHIKRHHDLGAHRRGHGHHMRPCLVILVGDGEVGATLVEGLGAAGGDGGFVGHADDQRLLAAQQRRGQGGVHETWGSQAFMLRRSRRFLQVGLWGVRVPGSGIAPRRRMKKPAEAWRPGGFSRCASCQQPAPNHFSFTSL
jgi:hypothetical protein